MRVSFQPLSLTPFCYWDKTQLIGLSAFLIMQSMALYDHVPIIFSD
jgi:hypothetical protein